MKKRKILTLGLVVLIIMSVLCGCAGNSTEQAQVINHIPTAKSTPNAVPASQTQPAIYNDTVVSLIESTYQDNFDYFTVESVDAGISICIGIDGLSKKVSLAKMAGNDETYKPWLELKDSILELYDAYYNLIESSTLCC